MKKYLRGPNGLYEAAKLDYDEFTHQIGFLRDDNTFEVLIPVKEADTIKELCDAYDIYRKWNGHNVFDQTRAEWSANEAFQYAMEYYNTYKNDGDDVIWFKAAIWTDEGLKYVAEMNEDKELELL